MQVHMLELLLRSPPVVSGEKPKIIVPANSWDALVITLPKTVGIRLKRMLEEELAKRK